MPILQPLQYARPTRSYVGAPVEELQLLGEKLEGRYQFNKERLGKFNILANNLDVRDVNKPLIEEELVGVNDRVKSFVDSGAYENLSGEIDSLVTDFSSNKLVSAALDDRKKSAVWKDEVESLYKAGKLDPDTYQNTLKLTNSQNRKSLVWNPNTKTYDNIFSGYSPVEYQDIEGAMFEKAKGWQASTKPVDVVYTDAKGKQTTSRIIYDPKNRGFVFTESNKSVSEEELQSALTTSIMNNPKYMAYINQNLMFRKNNMLEGRTNKEVYESDIFSNNPADGALFNTNREEARKQIEDAGYKYDEMMADPEMREALYDVLYRRKAIDNYVNPAVAKEGYSEIESKLYDDKVYLEQIKFANDLKLQRQKAHDNANLEILKNRFEKERAVSYLDSQPGTLVGSPFVLEKIPGRLTELDGSISKLETDMKNGSIDYATGKNLMSQYQHEKSMLNNISTSKQVNYLETADGNSYLNNQYEKYRKATVSGGKQPESKEWFKNEVIKTTFDLAHQNEKTSSSTFSQSGRLQTNSLNSPRYDILSETWRTLKSKSAIVEDNNNLGNSSFANVLSGFGDVSGKDATTIDIYNKGLSLSLNNYSKDYLAWTPEGMKPLNDIKQNKKYKDKEIEVVGAFYDSPIYDTWYYQANVKDKKTGQILDTYSVMPKDQNTAQQNYQDLSKDIFESRGNDAFGNKAKQTLSHIAFPDLKTSQLNLELSNVDEDSEPGAISYSSVREVGTGKFIISKEKVSFPILDDNNKVIGSAPRLVYKAVRAKDTISSGTKVDGNTIYDMAYNNNGNYEVLINPRYQGNEKALELKIANYFPSIEDIKSNLYDLIPKNK